MMDNRAGQPPLDHLRSLGLMILIVIVIALMLIAALPRRAQSQNYDYLTIPLIALSNTAQTVKASPGTLLGYSCVNPNVAAVFIQVYDSIGVIVVGTTVPRFNFRVAPTSSTGFVQPQVQGAYYAAAGLQAAATTLAGGSAAPPLPVPCDFSVR